MIKFTIKMKQFIVVESKNNDFQNNFRKIIGSTLSEFVLYFYIYSSCASLIQRINYLDKLVYDICMKQEKKLQFACYVCI